MNIHTRKHAFTEPLSLEHKYLAGSTLYIREEVDAQQRATDFDYTCKKKTDRYLSESIIDKTHDNRKSLIITYANSVNGDISRKNPIFPFHSEE